MNISFIVLPIAGALIGFLSSLITVKLLFKSYQTSDVATKLIDALIQKVKQMDLKADLNDLLDIHLAEFIVTLRQQIPMANMFLTGSFSEKLKVQAKEEFMKMLPDLKEKIWFHFSKDLSFIENMIKESVSKRMVRISLATTFLGLLLGFLLALVLRALG